MKPTLLPLLSVAAGLALAASPSARAAYTILHTFTGFASDGNDPHGSLTLSGTTLYGMTVLGGSSGAGTLFRMNADGSGFSTLHSFTGGVADGRFPYGSLTLSGSTFYGMTHMGGSSDAGTIFRMNADGTGYSLLRSFAGGAADGRRPLDSLTLSGTVLYGMTFLGGSSDGGTLFRMNADGSGFSLLHSFTGGAADGSHPVGSLTLSGSTLYGMTQDGGSGNEGTIFRINADGTGYSLLHTFTGGAGDGLRPNGSLTLSGSTLYGMTLTGGSTNAGTNVDGTGFSLLHTFTGASGGRAPFGSLTLSGSTLYGMTHDDGIYDHGTLFRIGTDGSGYGVLESFGSGFIPDAATPLGDLTLSADASTLYGMTSRGGTTDGGAVFSRAVPEPASTALLGFGTLLLAARHRATAQRAGRVFHSRSKS